MTIKRTLVKLISLVLIFNVYQVIAAESYKIGLAVWSGYPECVAGFKQALASEGLVEGQNIEFITGKTGANKELQTNVATGFREQNLDLVFTLTTPGTTIIKEIMPQSTPLIFSIVTYPADSGLIESFEYSGNNLVGTSNYVPLNRYVLLLKKILPNARNLAIFHRKGEPNSRIQSANLQRLFKKENIKVTVISAVDISEIKVQAMKLIDKVDVFVTTTDTLIQGGGEQALIDISLKHNIPILSSNKKGIEQGATFGVVSDFFTLGRMSGLMAAKVLKEKRHPESLQSRIQEPPTYLVNSNSLKILGIKKPKNSGLDIKWIN
ncbi:MAG: ABC transporter substrate-binding protein [Kangiellaceae bacterium]|nr:ABC transporter substrate-binding protein [Kangiellaceae bacterium]